MEKIGYCEKRVWKDRFIIDCGKGVAINMRRYLLNGRIMTMASEKKGNRKNKVRPLYENGYLLIEKGKIAAIGDMEELGHIPKSLRLIAIWELRRRKRGWKGMTVMKM